MGTCGKFLLKMPPFDQGHRAALCVWGDIGIPAQENVSRDPKTAQSSSIGEAVLHLEPSWGLSSCEMFHLSPGIFAALRVLIGAL